MPVEVRLNKQQIIYYEEALNKAKIEFKARGPFVEVSSDTLEPIINALKASHLKSFNLKTKSIAHHERLYNLQQVIPTIEALAVNFADKIVNMADNDTDVVEGEAA